MLRSFVAFSALILCLAALAACSESKDDSSTTSPATEGEGQPAAKAQSVAARGSTP